MLNIKTIIDRLKSRQKMTFEEIQFFLEESIAGHLLIAEQKDVLLALNEKGYSGDEIAYFIKVLYKQMPVSLQMPNAIDICGTGGSGLPRINTSTITAFILSACDVKIAKHGNKAASGRFGSFDLLEKLGINIEVTPKRLESIFQKTNLAFIFARQFHPAMKHFAAVRTEIKAKTIFNILGPLLNPANTEYQIIGVSNADDMPLIIEAAKTLDKKHVLVVHGNDKLDEVTLTGETKVMELKNGEIKSYTLTPEDFGFNPVLFENIAGGEADLNIQLAKNILNDCCKTDHLNLILINVALILKFIGKVTDYQEGVQMAKKVLNNGRAKQQLETYRRLSQLPDILAEIAAHKIQEIDDLKKRLPLVKIKEGLKKSDHDFKKALRGKNNLSLIAEIKRASPSNPEIYKGNLEATDIAKIYEKNNVAAISVVTDQKYFKGNLEDLQSIRKTATQTPLLMKDFIIDLYQIYLARYFGADAILLIASLFNADALEQFLKITRELGMDALVEVHNEHELKQVLNTSADIIGINNRNLHTFEVDPKTVLRLLPQIPTDKLVIAESGYNENNLFLIKGQCNGALIGTSIMQSENIAATIQNFQSPKKILKICGVTNEKIAQFCNDQGVAMVGFNFVPSSHRFVSVEQAKKLRPLLTKSVVVGVFQNQPVKEINHIAEELQLDYVQLSGDELPDYCHDINQLIIKTIRIDEKLSEKVMIDFDQLVQMYIIDSSCPGSGESYNYTDIQKLDLKKPFLVAGGITIKNAKQVLKQVPDAIGIDVASGAETNRKKDLSKIENLLHFIS